MGPFPVYVLNLDRNRDRLEAISQRLQKAGITWERFSALDGRRASEGDLVRYVGPSGPLGDLGRGARACTAGHFHIWERFLKTGAPVAVILEDDVEFSPALADFLRTPAERLKGCDVLKLEYHKLHKGTKTLFVGRREFDLGNGLKAARLLLVHYGTGGYAITRAAAQFLVQELRHTDMPIDHLLFNPNVSKFARRKGIWQVYPALVRQNRADFASEIGGEKPEKDGFVRRLKRLYFEISQIPKILLMLVTGRARVLKLLCIRET